MSADGRHVLSGGFGKRVVVRRLHDLQPVKILCACESSIRALDLTTDERFGFEFIRALLFKPEFIAMQLSVCLREK